MTSTSTTPTYLLHPAPPLDGFPQELFRDRRNSLRASFPDCLIILAGQSGSSASATEGPFLQESNFYYLTGVSTPDAVLVLLPENLSASSGLFDLPSATREILFLPARNPGRELWSGARLGPGEETAKLTGIEQVVGRDQFLAGLPGWLRRCPRAAVLCPAGESALRSDEYRFMQQIKSYYPAVTFQDLTLPLSHLRMLKSAEERAEIEKAIAVTYKGQEAARNLIARGAGKGEYEVEAALAAAFRSEGCLMAFAPIVGGGINSTILHYEDNRELLNDGETVVIDIGARVGHYCGDITRTYPVGGRFNPRQREIYSLVLAASRELVAGFRPGVESLRSMKERCKAFLLASSLRAIDENGEEQTMDHFLPHGVSHHLGLDVHDAGDPEVLLQPGNIITVEPGVYIPTERIGVRLEDDFLVTETGLVKLGPLMDLEPEAIEALMAN